MFSLPEYRRLLSFIPSKIPFRLLFFCSQTEQLIAHLLDSVHPLCRDLASDARVYCAQLWSLCTSASDCGTVKGHALVVEAGAAVQRVSAGIKEKTIAVRELKDLLAVSQEQITAAFGVAGCALDGSQIK
jgi:hypothetical protein